MQSPVSSAAEAEARGDFMATADFVTQLFQNMFGRAPSPDELNAWVGRIDSGTETSTQVAVDLVNSSEGVNAAAIERLYQAAFGRTPDLAGFKVQAGSGLALDVLARNFVGSTEFQAAFVNANGGAFDVTNFATKLYTNILGRGPDPDGLAVQVNFYNSLVSSGHTAIDARATLLQNFANSPELTGNLSVNFDKEVLLWAGLDNNIPVSTTAAPNTMLQQANGVTPLTLATLLNDGINGNDIPSTILGGQIQVPAGAAGTLISGTNFGDVFSASWASLNGSTVDGNIGSDMLMISGAPSDTTVALNSVERVILQAASAPAKLTLNIANATNPGQIDTLALVGASGANKIGVAAIGIENINYEADGAPGSSGSVIDFTGSTSLTNLTIRGSQSFTISGFAGNATPALKIDASSATGFGSVDLGSYAAASGATVLGGAGGNTISGSVGADTISGGAGNDTIVGGAGIDTLTGGGGDDLFRFTFNSAMGASDAPATGQADTITDFTRAAPGAVRGFDRIEVVDLAGIAKLSLATDKTGTYNGYQWWLTKGVFSAQFGNPHISGGFLAAQIYDTLAPSIGDSFVYYSGEFGFGSAFLFVQGGANDVLIQLKGLPIVGTPNLVAEGILFLN
jgi:Ca2+-binding RTX toxin-like protein